MRDQVPEPSESQDDKAYCEYLEGHSRGATGFLMMIAGLEAIYEAMDEEEEENSPGKSAIGEDGKNCCTKNSKGGKHDRISS